MWIGWWVLLIGAILMLIIATIALVRQRFKKQVEEIERFRKALEVAEKGLEKEEEEKEEKIDVKRILEKTNERIRQANPEVIKEALIVKGIYIIGVLAIMTALAMFIPYGVIISSVLFSLWVILVLVRGFLSVGTNQLVFVRFFKTVIRAKGPGLAFCLWPIENFNPLGINLRYIGISFEMTIEIGRTEEHPRTWVDIKRGKIVGRIVEAFKFGYEMPGETKEAKAEVIIEKIADEIQTFINEEKMSEDKVLALAGRLLAEKIRDKAEETLKKTYGFMLLDLILGKPERSEYMIELTKREYEGVAEGEKKKREMQGITPILFGEGDTKKLSTEQREDLKRFFIKIKTIESIARTDKTIFGAPKEIEKEIIAEQIAEEVSERNKQKQQS